MNIAIFGATSQIAKDLIVRFANQNVINCTLFSRRESDVESWLDAQAIKHRFMSLNYDDFSDKKEFDAIINLVGVGNPARAADMGTAIFEVTKKYDDIIVDYLQNVNKKCKYIFFSSGAAYGNSFSKADDLLNESKFSINDLNEQDWYGLAKFQTELRHRLLSDFIICDLRVFSYFSESQDINNSFMMSEIAKAIINDEVFETSDCLLYRDFVHPDDLFDLVKLIMDEYECNGVLDCYSKKEIEKINLVKYLSDKLGLKYKIDKIKTNDSIRNKVYYYSKNKHVGHSLGYRPKYSSSESIVDIIKKQKSSI